MILGFSSIFADAVSMGAGDAMSTKAENDYILAEKSREEWCVSWLVHVLVVCVEFTACASLNTCVFLCAGSSRSTLRVKLWK